MRPDSTQGKEDRVFLISYFLLRGQRVQQGKQQWHTQLQSRTPALKPDAQRSIEWSWGENRHPNIVQNHTLFTVEPRLQNSCRFNYALRWPLAFFCPSEAPSGGELMPLPFPAARQSARAYRKHAQIQARTHKADMDFEASFRKEAP